MRKPRVLSSEESAEARAVLDEFVAEYNDEHEETIAHYVELPYGNFQLVISLREQHNMGPKPEE